MKKTITLALAAATCVGSLGLASYATARPQEYNNRSYRYDEADRYYRDACRQEKRDRRRAGAVIGGIAGAVIGSNATDNRTTGAVVGGATGAVVGSHIGGHTANCDRNGAYWSRNETYGYSDRYYYRGRYDDSWYDRHRCRWARDWRGDYVRVCPDGRGRYRIAY
ncbi:MAG: glycine zipper 2TM domain-containing protein [Caulobacteraceae bacterium]|nr:glycine zipper 2TM domain-containing protein [Caulobacteraceae bacterium]